LRTAEAANALAHGEPGRALEIVDANAGPLSGELRLERARALAALGNLEDARLEAVAARTAPAPNRPGEAVELEADMELALGHAARALQTYDGAWRLGRHGLDLRAKHAAAAARAGETRAAAQDLAALEPQLAALSPERARNQRLAPLAPLVY